MNILVYVGLVIISIVSAIHVQLILLHVMDAIQQYTPTLETIWTNMVPVAAAPTGTQNVTDVIKTVAMDVLMVIGKLGIDAPRNGFEIKIL